MANAGNGNNLGRVSGHFKECRGREVNGLRGDELIIEARFVLRFVSKDGYASLTDPKSNSRYEFHSRTEVLKILRLIHTLNSENW